MFTGMGARPNVIQTEWTDASDLAVGPRPTPLPPAMTQHNFHGTSGDDDFTGTAHSDVFLLQQGGNDTVAGLADDDFFRFGATFTADDRVDGGDNTTAPPGGDGYFHGDVVYLNGDYSGGVVFGPTTMQNVEHLVLLGGGLTITVIR